MMKLKVKWTDGETDRQTGRQGKRNIMPYTKKIKKRSLSNNSKLIYSYIQSIQANLAVQSHLLYLINQSEFPTEPPIKMSIPPTLHLTPIKTAQTARERGQGQTRQVSMWLGLSVALMWVSLMMNRHRNISVHRRRTWGEDVLVPAG